MTDIETDIVNHVCRFSVTKPDSGYEAKLAEFAKTNSHLADYVIQ